MAYTRKPLRTEQERRDAFFTAAGITDTSPYEAMDLGDAIEAIRQAAGITHTMIGPSHQAAQQQIQYIKEGQSRFGRTEKTLGQKFRHLLDKAAAEGRIDRASGRANPEWLEIQKVQRLQQSLATQASLQASLKESFCTILGINPQDYQKSTLAELIRQWHRNAELYLTETSTQSADTFYKLNDITKIDPLYVNEVAHTITAKLAEGIAEGWIDPARKTPLPVETILRNKLGESIAVEGSGKGGLRLYVEKLAARNILPIQAIGPMSGQEPTWIAPSQYNSISLSEVAHAADVIAPYVRGEKQWTGVVEVTNPEYLRNHAIARDYMIASLKARLLRETAEEKGAFVDAVLTPLPDTLGPAMRKLRKAVGLSQSSFGDALTQHQLGMIERNMLNPRCIEENEGKASPREALRVKLDQFAEVIAQHMRCSPFSGQGAGIN